MNVPLLSRRQMLIQSVGATLALCRAAATGKSQ